MIDSLMNEMQLELATKIMQAIRSDLRINLKGKRILDIGCGFGHKSHEMEKWGADVYVVEPNYNQLEWAIQNGLVSRDKAFNCKVQDLPNQLFGTFDLITIFMYRIVPSNIKGQYIFFSENPELGEVINQMQLDITKTIAKLIKSEGEVIIDMCRRGFDNYLYYPHNRCTPLMLQFKKIFEEASYVDSSYPAVFIKAKKPLSEKEIDKITFEEISMRHLSNDVSKYQVQAQLLKNGLYYDGQYREVEWAFSDDFSSMVEYHRGDSLDFESMFSHAASISNCKEKKI